MHVEASTDDLLATGADTLAVGLFSDGPADPGSAELVAGAVDAGEAQPDLGHVTVVHASARRFLVVGLGERARFTPEVARRAAAGAHARARELGAESLAWAVPGGAEMAAGLVQGTMLHAYRFERFRPPDKHPRVGRLILRSDEPLGGAVEVGRIVTEAQNRARELGDRPANDLHPTALADYVRELGGRLEGIEVEVWGEERIRQAGMGAFAAVARGSEQEACLIELRYEGPEAGQAPLLGLVGKAVTFDSGGLSIKSNNAMHEMKFDMAGGAAVIEAIAALAELRAPVRVLGVVGATENLPSGTAVKPGDIVRAVDGTTIEINNADAEGRLVLADCLCHARTRGAERLVDVATLTGAVVTALGSFNAGLMANDDDWAKLVTACGESSGETVWRLPLGEDYAAMVKGRYAQLTNRAERREAQAITAAELLHPFAGGLPWAHLDIAGTAYDVPRSYLPGKGATGFGVRLLVELALAAAGGR